MHEVTGLLFEAFLRYDLYTQSNIIACFTVLHQISFFPLSFFWIKHQQQDLRFTVYSFLWAFLHKFDLFGYGRYMIVALYSMCRIRASFSPGLYQLTIPTTSSSKALVTKLL